MESEGWDYKLCVKRHTKKFFTKIMDYDKDLFRVGLRFRKDYILDISGDEFIFMFRSEDNRLLAKLLVIQDGFIKEDDIHSSDRR